ncbi:unnamed protein product [Mytilus coruscus]|uniref:Uncharacterized protein n=1 Tax=Mytilus coruscus TaxID=42192 RepID=A0A6J8DID9_MYTCO|nr:unnamed protein product [Mytilus coruscus]
MRKLLSERESIKSRSNTLDKKVEQSDTDMIFLIEPDPDTYTSISLTLKTLKACEAYDFLKAHLLELNNVLQKPRIVVYNHGDQLSPEELNHYLGHTTVSRCERISAEDLGNCHQWTSPLAIVVLLTGSGGHGSCRLSHSDFVVLKEMKKNFNDSRYITFVIKKSRLSMQYNLDDVNHLSEEIQLELCGTSRPNNIFLNMFLFNDKQISVRIGLRMHKSIQGHLFNIKQNSNHLINEIKNQCTILRKAREELTKSLCESILNVDVKYCSHALSEINQTFIKPLAFELSNFLKSEIDGKLLKPLITAKDVKILLKRCLTAVMKKKLNHVGNGTYRKHTKLRGMKYRPLCSTSHSSSTKCICQFSRIATANTAQKIYAELIKMCTKVKEDVETFRRYLEDECPSTRLHGVSVHELKTIANRQGMVSGFGYFDETVCVYINSCKEEDKKKVFNFFEQYLNIANYNCKYVIEFRKKREITYFAKLQNGSRINKFPRTGKNSKGYGTLGMFLKDNKGTYFFTTCAHVIEQDEEAYLPGDNSRIGENVFVRYPNTSNAVENTKNMDFSLIRVSPESDIECKLGLKSTSGSFLKGQIFKGDISEILGRRLYKWGATEPHLQTGKCIGIEEEEFIYIEMDKENFAKPGDSGAIICAGNNTDTALAAFVLVGEWIGHQDRKKRYVVYKVSDALDLDNIKDFTPCLCTETFTVVSS